MAHVVTSDDIDDLTMGYLTMASVTYNVDDHAYKGGSLEIRHIVSEFKVVPESDVHNYFGSMHRADGEVLTAPFDFSELGFIDGVAGARLTGSLLDLRHRPVVLDWGNSYHLDALEEIRAEVGLVDSLFLIESVELTEHYADEDLLSLLRQVTEVFPRADVLAVVDGSADMGWLVNSLGATASKGLIHIPRFRNEWVSDLADAR